MTDIWSFVEFLLDIVLMIPPLDEVGDLNISRATAMGAAFGSILLLVVAFVVEGARDREDAVIEGMGPLATIVLVVLVLAIGFVSAPKGILEGIFAAAYPPMMIALRAGELSRVGYVLAIRLTLLQWGLLSGLFGGVAALLYFLLVPRLDNGAFVVKCGWTIVGSVVGAVTWTTALRGSGLHAGTLFGLFLVFVSTTLYVAVAPPGSLERIMFAWSVPAGLPIGAASGLLVRSARS